MKENKKVIDVMKLPIAANICDQLLREVWHNNNVSIAHVLMEKGATSLLHKHNTFTELYYFIEGEGMLELGEKKIDVKPPMLVEVTPGTPHRLKNTTNKKLEHLVISNPAFDRDDVEVMNG